MGQRGVPLPGLRWHRQRAGWTQADLAARTKVSGHPVSVTTINRLERLPAAPAEARTMRALAAALGVEPRELMRVPQTRTPLPGTTEMSG